MTADALRRMAWSASTKQASGIKQETRDKEALACFEWLEKAGVTYIELVNGEGLDVGNLNGNLRYAIYLAKREVDNTPP